MRVAIVRVCSSRKTIFIAGKQQNSQYPIILEITWRGDASYVSHTETPVATLDGLATVPVDECDTWYVLQSADIVCEALTETLGFVCW